MAEPFPGEAVTLADLERALGVRVGPFADLRVQQGLDPTSLQVDALRSSAETAGWENLFVLRRGVFAAGAVYPAIPGEPVPGFVASDRTRLVKSFAAESGSLEVDRDYTLAPVAGERVELHVLHPDWELRRAALDGLERVFLFDRVPLVPPPPAPEVALGALTQAYPWLTDRSQVYGVEYGPVSDPGAAEGVSPGFAGNPYGVLGIPLRGWDALQGGGAVVLQLPDGNAQAAAAGIPASTLWVLVRRPGWSLVNGAEWQPGHVWQDDDVLDVPLSYAAAAAHVACWRVARQRLTPGANAGMSLTENDCGRELTRQTARWFRPDVRAPEDRYPPASRHRWPGGGSLPHWSSRGGDGGWIVNG